MRAGDGPSVALRELGRLVGRGLASHLGEHRVCHGAPTAHTAEPKSQVQDTHRPVRWEYRYPNLQRGGWAQKVPSVRKST